MTSDTAFKPHTDLALETLRQECVSASEAHSLAIEKTYAAEDNLSASVRSRIVLMWSSKHEDKCYEKSEGLQGRYAAACKAAGVKADPLYNW